MKQSLTQLLKPETSTLFSERPSLLLLCEITHQVLSFLLNVSILSIPTASILVYTSSELWEKSFLINLLTFSPSILLYIIAGVSCLKRKPDHIALLLAVLQCSEFWWSSIAFLSSLISFYSLPDNLPFNYTEFLSVMRLWFIYRMLHKYLLYLAHFSPYSLPGQLLFIFGSQFRWYLKSSSQIWVDSPPMYS